MPSRKGAMHCPPCTPRSSASRASRRSTRSCGAARSTKGRGRACSAPSRTMPTTSRSTTPRTARRSPKYSPTAPAARSSRRRHRTASRSRSPHLRRRSRTRSSCSSACSALAQRSRRPVRSSVAPHIGISDRFSRGLVNHRVALGFLSPAAVAMSVLVAAPFVIGLLLGFYDHHQGTWTFIGLDNFTRILSGNGHSLDDPLNFWFILGVTVLWTVANIALHVTVGVSLALVLSRKWLRGKGLFRMLLILPWAIQNYITALMWKGMFQGQYGAVNSLLHAVGLSDVSWFGSWATAFSANVITNTWLGFPFMMVVALGALETIPKELYEAASVAGARR